MLLRRTKRQGLATCDRRICTRASLFTCQSRRPSWQDRRRRARTNCPTGLRLVRTLARQVTVSGDRRSIKLPFSQCFSVSQVADRTSATRQELPRLSRHTDLQDGPRGRPLPTVHRSVERAAGQLPPGTLAGDDRFQNVAFNMSDADTSVRGPGSEGQGPWPRDTEWKYVATPTEQWLGTPIRENHGADANLEGSPAVRGTKPFTHEQHTATS